MHKKYEHTNASISYSITGNTKPVVVLLHGFGEDATVWHEQVNFLEQHYSLIVPDLPGSGNSFFKNNETASFIDTYADIVADLLKHEHIDQCIMLGHSMGGYITLAFAEKYPNSLHAFGLIHSTAFADSDEKKQNRSKGISMMKEYGGYAFLKTTTPNLFSADYKKHNPAGIDALIEKGKAFSTIALQDYYRAMMERPDRTEVLQQSKLPVLFIIGTEDVAAPMNDVLKQTHLPGISFIYILDKTGHMGMWERPLDVNNAIESFVSYTQSS